jgi:hypothetical protein
LSRHLMKWDSDRLSALDDLRLEYGDDALKQRVATRSCQSNDEQASMSAGGVPAHIREVEVLRDEETLRGLRRAPDIRIRLALEALLANRVDVVTECAQSCDETLRQILVEVDPQRLTGVSTSGRSSWAEASANAIAARTSSQIEWERTSSPRSRSCRSLVRRAQPIGGAGVQRRDGTCCAVFSVQRRLPSRLGCSWSPWRTPSDGLDTGNPEVSQALLTATSQEVAGLSPAGRANLINRGAAPLELPHTLTRGGPYIPAPFAWLTRCARSR